MLANLITLSRIVLLIVVFFCLSLEELHGHTGAFFLTILLIALDGVDGMVARYFHQESEFGSIFDIVVDRIVENCFWIFFATRGIIPAWFPMVVVSRGFLTDSLRGVALSRGMTAFGSKSLHRTKLGTLLVSSRFSRGFYGVIKVFSFLFLISIDSVKQQLLPEGIGTGYLHLMVTTGYITIYCTLIFCVLRGIPVLVESRGFLRPESAQ
ncbi:MAG: CDP-alcohol phosphatidyltransferase family protein [Geobacteraceae bacterium]